MRSRPAVVALLALAGVAAGSPFDGLYRKLEVLAEVFAQVEGHYVDPVGPTDLVYGAARGVLSVLDAHSNFYTPDEYRALVDSTEGEYAGVGMELDIDRGLPEVRAVYPDAPAAQAGLRVGDVLLSLDGRDLEGLDLEAINRLLRGPVGSRVALGARRAGRDDAWRFELTRAWVRVAPLAHRTVNEAQVVQLKIFSRHVATELAALLAHHPPIHGLVLDLRGNPGGLFDEAVAVCDLFLRDGPIVTAVGRGGVVVEAQEAHAHGTLPDHRLAVLIDAQSASAAEIVAGALHDRGRARLFGTRSYGKGSVQNIVDLSDGSGLKLTIARYMTPSGVPIDGRGIAPDEQPPPGPDDPTLAAALRYLQSAARP